jgi:FlaA1/EpsC-like NDP-sugar epimerase
LFAAGTIWYSIPVSPQGVAASVGVRRAFVIAVHLALWTLSLVLAFQLRFDFRVPWNYAELMGVCLPLLLGFRTIAFFRWGLFRGIWRYTGANDLIAILKATTVASLALTAVLVFGVRNFPRSVVIIEWLTAVIIVGGLRFSIRWLRPKRPLTIAVNAPKRQKILILGAGDGGEMLIRELQRRHADKFELVGLLDDDRNKRGAQIHGVRVLGPIEDLAEVVAAMEVDEAIIAIPSATGAQMRRLVDLCKEAAVRFKTIPGIDHLVDGRVTVNQIRDVAIEDLLGREPVVLDTALISTAMRGRVVMVTGAGGSIGSEICRQLCRFAPQALVLVERTENALFNVHRELLAAHPEVPLFPCIADVSDEARMQELFDRHGPVAVFHAAAHKHVPMMEWNPGEAIKNNVLGTRMLAELADRNGVERFVMISTDKAVNPTSVMGASKRAAEIFVQALSQRSRTRFVTVRFGNVLGSAGSVIPIFQEQIARGGPVTVTHPEMQRYFMTIPEASQLVLQAGTMGEGGEIFILDMGAPVRIADLARDLIALSGLRPGVDIDIRFTGIRPGEKLFEEIAVDAESAEKTRHPKIYVGRLRPHAWDAVQRQLSELERAAGDGSERIRAKLRELVPEYRPDPHAAPAEAVPVSAAARRAANE